eukprot:TRINITY_DN1216_c0_g1_i1.p2 TRINITY_DN1216_c0_g1~~TRINITY_DN1216_c0_g1_i1.p2  ORF type:complete len:53 (+),score=17.53 TRINITY_DN1216_c0_g1_i1:295-453(+)
MKLRLQTYEDDAIEVLIEAADTIMCICDRVEDKFVAELEIHLLNQVLFVNNL